MDEIVLRFIVDALSPWALGTGVARLRRAAELTWDQQMQVYEVWAHYECVDCALREKYGLPRRYDPQVYKEQE